MDITFQSFLDPQGIVAAGALTTGLVALIKSVFPVIDARVSGALQAFIVTAILYVGVLASTTPAPDANGILTIFAAWLACATAAIGIHGTQAHITAQR